MATIRFINHACVKVQLADVCILMDPWIDGPVFNDGWDLLVATTMSVDEIMAGVTHIFLSHEHPDHFSPSFLSRISKRPKPLPKIICQKTRDERVAAFARKKGFEVSELESFVPERLGATTKVTCVRNGFYDSLLLVEGDGLRVLNLNDCHYETDSDIQALAERLGRVDVLLTQFSYAAWKGGKDRRDYRELAAAEKLGTVRRQIAAFQPKAVIPFASFAYFSSTENAYMNDAINRVHKVAEIVRDAGAQPIVVFPGDRWQVGDAHDNSTPLERYGQAYDALESAPRRPPGPSVAFEVLEEQFGEYCAGLFAENSRWAMVAASYVPRVKAFAPVVIDLWDLGLRVSVSPLYGFDRSDASPDCAMHSSSLSFIFKNPFGFDTLTVNGRFEAGAQGFAKMTRCLAIGSLNGMGLKLGPSIVLDAWAVTLLLRRLRVVTQRLRQAG